MKEEITFDSCIGVLLPGQIKCFDKLSSYIANIILLWFYSSFLLIFYDLLLLKTCQWRISYIFELNNLFYKYASWSSYGPHGILASAHPIKSSLRFFSTMFFI